MSSLQVRVTIDPVPASIDPEAFNQLCDGELVEFDDWQQNRMRASGLDPSPLIGAERGTLKAYLLFVATRNT